jgi:hypothetical protein
MTVGATRRRIAFVSRLAIVGQARRRGAGTWLKRPFCRTNRSLPSVLSTMQENASVSNSISWHHRSV